MIHVYIKNMVYGKIISACMCCYSPSRVQVSLRVDLTENRYCEKEKTQVYRIL
jgi:hypothetical protein